MKTFASKDKKHLSVHRNSGAGQAGHHFERARQAGQIRRILGGPRLQPKLKVSDPNDAYEQQADRVADAVMRMPDEALSRQPLEEEDEELLQTKPTDLEESCPDLQRQVEEEEEEETVQTKPLADQITPLVQRQEAVPEEEEELQAKAISAQTPEVTPNLESRIQALKGGGQPLPESTRAFFEPRFGQDFSQVRVHTDGQAAETARAVNAKAFTVGKDMVFGAEQYSPETVVGKTLIAHELMHVIQQDNIEWKEICRQQIYREREEEYKSEYTGPLQEVLRDTIEGFIESLLDEKIPYYKYAKLAVRIGDALGKGIAEKILSIRNSAKKKGGTGSYYSRKEIQRKRRYLAEAVRYVPKVLRHGMVQVVKEVIEIIEESLGELIGDVAMEVSIKEPLKELGDKLGDVIGDILSGDYLIPEIISQGTEDAVQETVAELTEIITQEFIKSAYNYSGKQQVSEAKVAELFKTWRKNEQQQNQNRRQTRDRALMETTEEGLIRKKREIKVACPENPGICRGMVDRKLHSWIDKIVPEKSPIDARTIANTIMSNIDEEANKIGGLMPLRSYLIEVTIMLPKDWSISESISYEVEVK